MTTGELLISDLGTNTPFQLLDEALILGGALVLSNSDAGISNLIVQSTVNQVGGTTDCGFLEFAGGSITVSNGDFSAGSVQGIFGSFSQYGGTATIGSCYNYGGAYIFSNVDLTMGPLELQTSEGGGSFYQAGGTNHTASIDLDDTVEGVSYVLTNGVLYSGSVSVDAPNGANQARFSQIGGLHFITNELYVAGAGYEDYDGPGAGSYSVNNGSLSAGSITLDATEAGGEFAANNSSVTVAEDVNAIGLSWSYNELSLSGGSLTCSNILSDQSALNIDQSGGALAVNNLLMVNGFYPIRFEGEGWVYGQGGYTLSGGTLFASNIELISTWTMSGITQAANISNPGFIEMAGNLNIGNSTVHLGQFILASLVRTIVDNPGPEQTDASSNAVINFTAGMAQLSFANSSSDVWSNGITLTVTNWGGALGGGGGDQLIFGDDSTGLTTSQLAQIQFVNPIGVPGGTYPARILASGEVVPSAPLQLMFTQQGAALILTWSPGQTLQFATNAAGPYSDLPGAVPPYTNFVTNLPHAFFRLKQ